MTTLTATTPAFGPGYLPGPFQRPAPAAGSGPTGADFLRALRQRLVLIVFLWFVLIGFTVAGTLYWRNNFPKYEASSIIRVESLAPPNPEDPLRREASFTQADIERELQNQVYMVKSPVVLTDSLKHPDIKRTKWYQWAEKEAQVKKERLQDLLLDILSVGPVPDSNYVRVSASWSDKSEVATIVNVVVEQYVNEVNKQQRDAVNRTKEEMTSELDRASKSYSAKNQAIADFTQRSEATEADMAEAQEKLLTLSALLQELDLEVAGRKSAWEAIQSVSPDAMPLTAELQAILNTDPMLLQLNGTFLESQRQLDSASLRWGPNHRVVIEAARNRDAAWQAFQQDRNSKIVQFHTRQRETAERMFLEASASRIDLMNKLATARAELKDKQAKLAEYNLLLDERDQLKLKYEKLLDQKNMLEMITRQKQTVQIDVAARATQPERMSSPDLLVWIPAGTFFGLLVSVGLAMLLELVDKSVRTPRDVNRAHLPVLGTIPTTDDDEVEIDRVETACLDAPHSVVAEAFRNLRANLFFSAPAEQQGVILVTSPSGGNGKTTVATNLAISIALSGRRVLLIDANFRRSALPRVFPGIRAEGLSNILIGQGELKDFVSKTNVPGLDVLSAGPLPPNPAELLGSSYLRDVVVDARSRYDQVIFDGPPVLLVSDAMVLAGAVDGVMLVCEYRNTSRGALQRTQANLEAINVRIFGAVLNKVQSRAGGYFRKQYREFYQYHEPDDDSPEPRKQLDAKQTAVAAVTAELLTAPDEREPRGGNPPGSPDARFEAIPATDHTDIPVEEADPEPPMAATIEEAAPSVEERIARAFRDIGEPPPPDSGFIPDMKDVEDVDHFQMPSNDIADIERASWQKPAETFDDDAPLVAEEPADLDEPLMADQVHDDVAPTGTAPIDAIEDEIDLGDDLADLDSEEFRIDDKFDLDDDFDDPNQTPKR